jgi:hypothetical protein
MQNGVDKNYCTAWDNVVVKEWRGDVIKSEIDYRR